MLFRSYDTIAPVLTCPTQPILVSTFGEIISNPLNFLTTATIGDNCTGVKLNYTIPKATDNCTANPSVSLINGTISGGNFPYGVTILKFLARDSANMTTTCDVQVVVAPKPTRFITTTTDTITACQNDLLDISATNVNNATYRWTYPNGFTTNLQRIQMSSALLGRSDWLRLTTTIGNCTYKDSVYVKILGLPFAVNDNYQTNTLPLSKVFVW